MSPGAKLPTKAELAKYETGLSTKLENILGDVRKEAENLARSPKTGIWNPFNEEYIGPLRKWPTKNKDRYLHADAELGRTHMVLAWYSNTFRREMEKADDYQWKRLIIRLKTHRNSLMAVAVTNGFNPRTDYTNSAIVRNLPLQVNDFPRNRSALKLQHPHEAYFDNNGNIKRCFFVNTQGHQIEMVNLQENVYNATNFSKYPRPDGDWPKQDGWPPAWPYPNDPQDPRYDLQTWPPCGWCEASTFQRARPTGCNCKIDNAFIEIIQYGELDSTGKHLNRGVRVLQAIKEGAIIGEYLGEFVPRGDAAEEILKDTTYVFEFRGPPITFKGGGGIKRQSGNTGFSASLSAGHRGTWARFINHSSKASNVEFDHIVVKRKSTIIVRALRDIKFGEELRANYGKNYFEAGEVVDEPEDTPMDGLEEYTAVTGGGGRKRRHDDTDDSSSTRQNTKRPRYRY